MTRDLRADAFDASPLALLVLDERDVVIVANAAACRFLGCTLAELVGMGITTRTDPNERVVVADMIALARSGELPNRREVWFVRPDHSLRLGGFSVSRLPEAPGPRVMEPSAPASPAREVVVVIRDITHERQLLDEASERARLRLEHEAAQRREAEGTAERAEMGLRLLINTIPDLALVHAEGRVVHVNDVSVAALGYDQPSDLVGTPLLDLVHPDDWVGVSQRTQAITETGIIGPPRVIHMRHKCGAYLDVEFVALPISFRNRPVVLGLGRDLTERKKLEAQIALGERLVAMGRLVAGIGHEINNPLSYVMANLELVEERLTDADAMDLIHDCRDGVERIHRIIAGLKDLSRGSGTRAPVDIRRMLERAIAMTHNEVRHRAHLVCEHGAPPHVLADDTRLTQVFVNLLVNAAQAIPEGDATNNEIRVATGADAAGRAWVEIRDTGPGIAPENLERIFDPFFTTKAVGVGTGLGLSISHSIVAEHGGTIEVTSELGRGSTFRVVLPPAPARVITTPPPPTAEPPPTGKRARVLVIDDEPAIGVVVRRTLGGEHDVVIATSGRDAMARINRGEVFDVILCDLMMPDMTGMDVHALLGARAPDYLDRIVFVTGGAFTDAANQFVRNARITLVEKPFRTNELRALVRTVASRAEAARSGRAP